MTIRKRLFRFWRWLTFRDNCEVCAGMDGARGNENIIDGVVMCDDCSAKHWRNEWEKSNG